MNRTRTRRSAASRDAVTQGKAFVVGFHGVRYQVRDVSRAVEFYTKSLGFTLGHQQLPAFANVSIENLTLLLSGPGASGSRPMPDGRRQEPGGWNRVVLKVADLPARIEALRQPGCGSATRWKSARPDGRSSWKIPMATPSSCSNQRDNAYSPN